jgi:hypothetical protein
MGTSDPSGAQRESHPPEQQPIVPKPNLKVKIPGSRQVTLQNYIYTNVQERCMTGDNQQTS